MRLGALGRFLDAAADLRIGVRMDNGDERVLPFCSDGALFEYIEQELTATSIAFRARSAEIGVMLEVRFTSPFYPRDVKLSTAPFFYVDVTVSRIGRMVHWKRVPDDAPPAGEFFLSLSTPGATIEADPLGLRVLESVPLRVGFEGADSDAPEGEATPERASTTQRIAVLRGEARAAGDGVRSAFDLSEGERRLGLVWAAHTDADVLQDMGVPMSFKYREFFANADEVAAFAQEDEDRIRRRTGLFDSLLLDSSLSKTHCDLIAYSFQSYLANTWWTRRPDGTDWFSVWEGVCVFHSTIDVEYNLGLLYFALWPELLEMTFREWARHEHPDGYLAHDMGDALAANGQRYPHPMECEENTNFILMLHAFWRWTGSDAPVRRHFELVRRLVQYLIRVDDTGNGFPNHGTANTIDDASPAVQFAREQTYLGVKCLAAFHAAARMAAHVGDGALARQWSERALLVRETLDREGWLGDHYAVCIDRDAGGVRDMWTSESLEAGELEGWDAYSIYAANALLYPLMVNDIPPVDAERMKTDIVTANERARIEYGCTHSSADRSNIWISQNLWRDYVGAYLGVDLLDNVDRYWAFLLQENTRDEGKCFIDTYVENNLCYYPRGITSIGALLALPGLRIDRVEGYACLRPVRAPCRAPLLPLADWDAESVPWVEFRLEDGRVRREVTGELPSGVTLHRPC